MSGLPAAFLATFLSQALGLLFEPIARGRFATITTVLGNLIFQSLDALGQLTKRLVEKPNDGIFALIVCCTDFFIAWQPEWFHASILLGFYVFDNVKVQSIHPFHA